MQNPRGVQITAEKSSFGILRSAGSKRRSGKLTRHLEEKRPTRTFASESDAPQKPSSGKLPDNLHYRKLFTGRTILAWVRSLIGKLAGPAVHSCSWSLRDLPTSVFALGLNVF